MELCDKPKIALVEPDAQYLLENNDLVVEHYSPDIELVFGMLHGRVVIKTIRVKGYYDDAVVATYVENARANNATHNCKFCEAQEKRLQAKIHAALGK